MTSWADEIAERISTHLFVVPINNSGSSFLTRALSTCRRIIYLRSEGQHVEGWGGPVPRDQRLSLIWGHAESDYESVLADPANYDWDHIRRTWYAAAHLRDENDSCIFLEKSPPHVARVGMLAEHFSNVKFIFLVRNPYAIVESIGRRRPRMRRFAKRASEHVLTCLRLQKHNAETFPNSLLLRYEDMCADIGKTQQAITQLVPELDDINLDQVIRVKGLYNESLRDMNADHIDRLPPGIVPRITEHFAKQKQLLDHFGYELL
jgi:hypothetical protein